MAHDLTTEAVRLAMGMQQLRAENASHNIARANTSGARATRLDFASMQGLLEQVAATSSAADGDVAASLSSLAAQPTASESQDAPGSAIHLDEEVADMAGANLQYQALADSLSRHFGLMRLAITGRG